MIAHILGKLHVSKSNCQAIKFVMKHFKKSYRKKFYALPVEKRKAFYHEVIRIHEANLKTYLYVMRGY
jgi:hypothetical protein